MSSLHNHQLPRLDQLTLSSDKNDDVQAKIFNGPFILDDSDDDDEGSFDEIGDTTGVKRVRSPTIASGTNTIFDVQLPSASDGVWLNRKLFLNPAPRVNSKTFARKRDVLDLMIRIAGGSPETEVGSLIPDLKNFKNASVIMSTGPSASDTSNYFGDRFIIPPYPGDRAPVLERRQWYDKPIYFQFIGDETFYRDDYKPDQLAFRSPGPDDYEHLLSKHRSNLSAHLWLRFGKNPSTSSFVYFGPMQLRRWDMIGGDRSVAAQYGETGARPSGLFRMNNITIREYLRNRDLFPPDVQTSIDLPRHPSEAPDEEQYMLLPFSRKRASSVSQ